MANCTNCGGPLGDGQTFCGNCGQPVGAGAVAAGAPPAPPTPPAAPTPPPVQAAPAGYGQQPAYGPGPGYPPGAYQAPRKSRKGLWIGLAALVLAIVVACVLVFAVFKDQIFDGGGAATGPEKVVQNLLTAMEDKDINAFFDLVAPGAFDELTAAGMTLDNVKALFAGEVFTYESMKFSDVKMQTETTGDGTATVSITGGSVTITENGATKTEDVRDSNAPVEFQCVQVDGKWYIDPATFN